MRRHQDVPDALEVGARGVVVDPGAEGRPQLLGRLALVTLALSTSIGAVNSHTAKDAAGTAARSRSSRSASATTVAITTWMPGTRA